MIIERLLWYWQSWVDGQPSGLNLLLEDEFHRRDGVHWKRRPSWCSSDMFGIEGDREFRGKYIRQWNGQLRPHGQRSGIHPLLGNELRRYDDVFQRGRPSQCRSFWLYRFEIKGDCDANAKVNTFACSGKSHLRFLQRTLKLPRGRTWLRPSVPARLSQAPWALGPRRGCCPLRCSAYVRWFAGRNDSGRWYLTWGGCSPIWWRLLAGTGHHDGMEVLRGGWTRRRHIGGGSGGSNRRRRDRPRYVLMDLIQMTQEVFDQVGFPSPPSLSSEDWELGSACHGIWPGWYGQWCTLVGDFIASVSLGPHCLVLHRTALGHS